MGDSEAAKLQKHLNLLRQEYVKLQNKTLDLEQKLAAVSATSGNVSEDTYASQLLKTSNDLHDKETFTDITVSFSGKKVRAHRVILAARSKKWCTGDLADQNEIELEEASVEVGTALMKWVYTDKADIRTDESFIMDLVRVANRYSLGGLRNRCERILMSSVSVSNCIRYYQTAEDIGATELKKYCAEIITNHWDDLETKDFVGMSAPLLYDMFKSKSNFPLHFAVRHHREDIVFLYLIEFNLQIPGKLNEVEPETGLTPLQIALNERQESIANTLVQHNCDINSPNSEGKTLLHRSIEDGDSYAANFLIKQGADVKAITSDKNETTLHLAASFQYGLNFLLD
ncbi:rabankyrin-5-like [Clytia hemisphaerica]|uniref:rabankyrin-5-like n=1 Tax=Clytia hemisphaerica TaxID=252671 RepID=UPI0034D73CC9